MIGSLDLANDGAQSGKFDRATNDRWADQGRIDR
jgi:hypothetical protein